MGTMSHAGRIVAGAYAVLMLSAGSGGAQVDEKPGKIVLQAEKAFGKRWKSQSEIFLTGEDGSNLTNLTDHRANDVTPVWSPDGKRILFQSDRSGVWEILVMDADGRNMTKVSETNGTDGAPSWSPDGKRIVFASAGKDGSPDLYAVDVTGTNLKRLTDSTEIELYPCWSPDGKTIAYVLSHQNQDRNVCLMDSDGTNPRRLVQDGSHPAWSPDGKRLAYGMGQGASFRHRSSPLGDRRRRFPCEAAGRHPPRVQQSFLVSGRQARDLRGRGRGLSGDRRGKRQVPCHMPGREKCDVSPLASGVIFHRKRCKVTAA